MVGVMISYNKGSVNLYIGGYNGSEYIRWYSDNIDDVDEITVKVADITQNSETAETVPKNLKHYNLLKQELKKEGLI
jgi:hypothetical protein